MGILGGKWEFWAEKSQISGGVVEENPNFFGKLEFGGKNPEFGSFGGEKPPNFGVFWV